MAKSVGKKTSKKGAKSRAAKSSRKSGASKTTAKRVSRAKKKVTKKVAKSKPTKASKSAKSAKSKVAKKPATKTKASKTTSAKKPVAKKPVTRTAGTRPAAKKKAKAVVRKKKVMSRAERAARQKKMRQFRKLLHTAHKNLVAAYNNTRGDTRNPNQDGTEDYIDYAVSSYSRDFMLSLTEMERRQLTLVEEALKRIERRQFGNCLSCGQAIPEKRLEVEPWARHCIRCQELEERGLLGDTSFDDEDETDSYEESEFEEDDNADEIKSAAE